MVPLAFIYKITNHIGRVYIGRTNNIRIRKYKYKNLNCKTQVKIYNSIKKYGWENHSFEVIENIFDLDLVKEKEIFWIEKYRSNFCKYPNLNNLNLTEGGEGITGYKHTKEYKQNMSLRLSNGKHHSSGRKLSNSQKKDISDGLLKYYSKKPKKIKCKKQSRVRLVLNTSNGIFYNGVNEAAKSANLTYQSLYKMLSSRTRNKTNFIMLNI